MKSEIRSNGRTEIRLAGERPIEVDAIAEILEAAGKGGTVRIEAEKDGLVMVVSVEH